MRRFGHHAVHFALIIDRNDHRLRPGNRAKHLQHHVRQQVAIPIEGGNDQALAAGGQQQGKGGVNQLRLVAHPGVAGRGGVQLFFEHAFVDGADGKFGAAEHFGPRIAGVLEGIVGHRPADAAADFFGAISHLIGAAVFPFAPFFGPVSVVAGHTHHADGCIDAGNGAHAGNAATGA